VWTIMEEKNKYMSIGNRLKSARKDLKFSQKSIAGIIGTTQSNYSKIERGCFPPSSSHIILLKENLNINPDWLLYGTPPAFIEKPVLNHYLVPIFSNIPLGPWEKWRESKNPDSFKEYVYIPELLTMTQYFALRVQDDSMEPVINNRDILVIDPHKNFTRGIGVIRNKSGLRIGNILYKESHITIIPFNPKYQEEETIMDDETYIYVPIKVISPRDI